MPKRKKLVLTAFLLAVVILAASFVFTKSRVVHHPEPAIAFVASNNSILNSIQETVFSSIGTSFGLNVPASKLYACDASGNSVWFTKTFMCVFSRNGAGESTMYKGFVVDNSIPIDKYDSNVNQVKLYNLQLCKYEDKLGLDYKSTMHRGAKLARSTDYQNGIFALLRYPDMSLSPSQCLNFSFQNLNKDTLLWTSDEYARLKNYFDNHQRSEEIVKWFGYYDNTILLTGYNAVTPVIQSLYPGCDTFGCPRLIFFDTASCNIEKEYQLLAYLDSGKITYAIQDLKSDTCSYPTKVYSKKTPVLCATNDIPENAQLAEDLQVSLIRGELNGTDLAIYVLATFKNANGNTVTYWDYLSISPEYKQITKLAIPFTDFGLTEKEAKIGNFALPIELSDIVTDADNNVFFRLETCGPSYKSAVLLLDRNNIIRPIDICDAFDIRERGLVATKDAIWYLTLPVREQASSKSVVINPGMTQLIRYDLKTGDKKVIYEADMFSSLIARID